MKTPKKSAKKEKKEEISPLMISEGSSLPHPGISLSSASSTSLRRNLSGNIEKTDRFSNIEKGLIPFRIADSKGGLSVRDAVILCQKAYYNFSVFRNAIDLMTELSIADIYFRGGSDKSKNFFNALLKKINIWNLQDQFFREYFRSGNVFIYRLDAVLKQEDIKKIFQIFGSQKFKIPYRYIILNPADIQLSGSLSFSADVKKYHKILTDYELERIRTPKTEEDKAIRDALPEEAKRQLNMGSSINSVYIPLEADKIYAVFYKKMDYEPFAVPMGYPVLEDINFKSELKRMDMAISRTIQQAVLLVTAGTDPDKGGVNQKNLLELQKLFENQSVGKVLIADYTTKAQFIIPQIGDLLDPKKYEIINADIQAGLNSMITGTGSSSSGDKSSSLSSKVEIFLARLKQARETFLNDFLIPEIKRIALDMNLKNYPTPFFDEVSLRESTQFARVYSRLIELGVLTPEEGLTAIDTGRLPSQEESIEAQKRFKGFKKDGLYAPLIGGGANEKSETKSPAGRPEGTKGIPQQNQRESKSKDNFSFSSVQENIILSQKVEASVESYLKKIHNVKKLNKQQKEVSLNIAGIIIANESPENWNDSVEEYCKNPIDKNKERISEIVEIASEYQTNTFMASILYHSKTNPPPL